MKNAPEIKGMSVIKQVGLCLLSWATFILEYLLRILYLLLPMGFFMLIMSLRNKSNTVTALDLYEMEKAEFQFIYPDVILVLMNPRGLKNNTKRFLFNLNGFIGEYRDLLFALLLIGIIVTLCILL